MPRRQEEYVRGDEHRIRQILLNLLANPIKFTPHGHVALRASYDASDGVFHGEVIDTGIGIPADKLEAIFEPFIQLASANQDREGTGLGLTITRRLAVLMGGSVTAESQLGQGSTFRFAAPLSPAASVEKPAETALTAIRGYRGDRKRVLVVDDSAANAMLLVDILAPL